MIASFLDFLANGIFSFLDGFFSILPQMPISVSDLESLRSLQIVNTVLSWVNYFIPLSAASAIVALWATSMMAYIGIKLAMKYTGEVVK